MCPRETKAMSDELPRGYYRPEELAYLQSAVKLRRPRTALEVGVFSGRSAMAIIEAMPENSALYCVDPWQGRPELFKQFRMKARAYNTAKRIVVIRGYSVDIARSWDGPELDLVHIDGDHRSLAVYQDIREWRKRMSKSGFFIGHDWPIEEVRFGLTVALEEGLLKKVGLSSVTRGRWPALWWALPAR